MKYVLKIRCAYCGLDMGTKPCDYEPKHGMDTSHSVCDMCYKKENDKIDALIAKQKEKKI